MATVREKGGGCSDGCLYVIRDFAIHKANDQYTTSTGISDFSGDLKSSL